MEVAPQHTQKLQVGEWMDGLDPTEKANPPGAPCGANNKAKSILERGRRGPFEKIPV